MGKGLKEFQLCDSRRLRKKPQHAQDDVTWTVRFVWCPFLGLEKYIEFGLPKAVLPSSARGCLCHPSCLLWFHVFWRTFEAAGCVPSVISQPQKHDCHTLQRVDLARPFLVSPAIKIEIENSLEMALSKAKSGSAWQSHFWQCGTLRPARNTKLLHYASKSKLGFVQAASFNATGEDHFLESKKPMCLRPRKWDCCSDLFSEKWRSFTKKQYFCKCNGMAGFRGTRLLIEGL